MRNRGPILLRTDILALLLIGTSLKPLFVTVKAAPTGVCCGSQGDCGGDEFCCTPESLDKADCDLTAPGYCRTTCSRSGATE